MSYSATYHLFSIATCNQVFSDVQCIPTTINIAVSFVGEGDPGDIEELIRQAIVSFPPDAVPGLVGFGNLQVTAGQAPTAHTDNEPADTETDTESGNTERSSNTAEDDAKIASRNAKPLVFAGVAVAGSLVVVVALLVVKQQRRKSRNADAAKHAPFRDDELEEIFDQEPEIGTDLESEPEIPQAKDVYYMADELSGSDVHLVTQALNNERCQYENCSSPTCQECEERRRQGTIFIPTSSHSKPPSLGSRLSTKTAPDTVQF